MPKDYNPYLRRFLLSLQNAFPVILFFLCGFAFVYGVFGMKYAGVVSVVTVFFQTRHKRTDNTPYRYVRLLIVGTFLILFAYLSAQTFALCILLNLLIPFVLVFTQSSQFNPKGYFSYAMIFVFLSLMPPDGIPGLLTEILIFILCVGLMALSIRLYARLVSLPAGTPFSLEGGFLELSEMLTMLAQPEQEKELERRFRCLTQDIHRQSYHQRFFSAPDPKNQQYDMFSTMLQRFAYLMADDGWRKDLDTSQILLLKEISVLLRDAAPRLDFFSHGELIGRAQHLLDHMHIEEGRIRIFCRSLLHMLILILKTTSMPREAAHIRGHLRLKNVFHQIRLRCSLESFEMRFAMRLSIVMTITCGLSFLLTYTRSYWIPLNAFILLQPSYEDSSYRLKTRSIGTFLGCCVEFLIQPLLPGVGSKIVFALIMISLMYCAKPGTWNQPIFSTCYALTMASMTMNSTIAITLRLLYLGAAVAIVFLVNRFFFPMKKDTQFRYNLKALFRLNNSYWDIIRQGTRAETSLSVSNEILTYFHMLYQECAGYLTKETGLPYRESLRMVLLNLWHMFSELEQIHFLVRTKSIRPEEQKPFLHLIDAIQEELYPIISAENFPVIRREIRYQEPEVTYVLNQYLDHAKKLLSYSYCIPF